jgi:ribonuclease P protein subunit RPR2
VFGALAARVVEDFAYRERARTTAFYVSEFLAPRLIPQDFLLGRKSSRVQFEFAVRNLVGRAWIQRVIVWSPEGQVLYSTDPRLVGRDFPFSTFLRRAVDGDIAWQSAGARNGITAPPQELEVFIPVIVPGSTRPVGVYDVVSKLSDLAPAVNQLKRSVGASVVLGILVLYAALFSIVHKASRDLERQQANLRKALVGTIRSLANAVDSRDQATGSHSSRVAEYAAAIAFAINLTAGEIREAEAAGYLHDLGKIGIPDALLTKRGPLTERERITIQKHSIDGYEILRPVSMPEQVKLAVRHSHERWDGNGYPDGLAGEQIPIIARVVAVADTYEALTTARPYRAAWTCHEAAEEIRRCSGTQFDPRVVDAFLKIWPRWVERAEKQELVSKVVPLRSEGTGTDGRHPR